MKILLISTTDVLGGAARGTYRLHEGLLRAGIDSHILTMYKISADKKVHEVDALMPRIWNKVAALIEDKIFSLNTLSTFFCPWSMQVLPRAITKKIKQINPDIVHVNGVKGFFPIKAFNRINKPIVWTFVDMWPLTGGCHYSGGCEKFKDGCYDCHYLKKSKIFDITKYTWKLKKRTFKNLPIHIACISKWLLDGANASKIFSEATKNLVHYGIDHEVYRPHDKRIAKNILNLDVNKTYILYGADGGIKNPRKGFEYVRDSLVGLPEEIKENISLLIFGEDKNLTVDEFDIPVVSLGVLSDDITLAIAYSAANVMMVPSLQEGFGQTALEAMSCGTPVIAFEETGVCDIITHKHNGYIAKYKDIPDLINGLKWLLSLNKEVSDLCRAEVLKEYTLDAQSKRYISIYSKILN